MRKFAIAILIVALPLLAGFTANKYFLIAPEDVRFTVPKGFPKPVYTFKKNRLAPEVFVLGRKLFYDPILSKDSTTSCASCHQRLAAFGHIDHALSHGINGTIGKRNVPTLQNLAWNTSFMWDGGVNHLEVQPLSPLTNPGEMGETLVGVLQKLKGSDMYVADFKAAYGDSVINSERILKALAQFTALMISADSRYDKYIRGDDTMSPAELAGLALFRDKCADCHAEPLFTNNKFESNGLPSDSVLDDKGRGAISKDVADNYRFKVPTLRNIERSYPYMHDGRFRNLRVVLDFYGNPGKYSPHASPEMRKIGALTDADKRNLQSFLMTLTDMAFLYDRRFVDPFMK